MEYITCHNKKKYLHYSKLIYLKFSKIYSILSQICQSKRVYNLDREVFHLDQIYLNSDQFL